MQKFVTAFNGARDYYELPVALNEIGRLAAHISDFYVPDWGVGFAKKIKGKVSNRRSAGLPSKKVIMTFEVAFRNLFLKKFQKKIDITDPYFEIDKALSMRAASEASNIGADLFLHSGNAYWAFDALRNCKKYLFQFHPHSNAVYEILHKDFCLYPEVERSFLTESDSQNPSKQRTERIEEWRMADKIFCASSFTKESIVQQGYNPANVFVCPYGADNLSFETTAENTVRDKCRFLFVGQGVQRKGLHHLLRAWKDVSNSESELVIVARRVDPGLKFMLDQEGIRYFPGVSQSDLNIFYAKSDYFVMPSLVEGFGLVYLEALKAGLPCIGTLNTGLPDLVLSDEFSMLAEAGNIDSLCEVMNRAFLRWKRNEIDKVSVKKSIDSFTWKKHRENIANYV